MNRTPTRQYATRAAWLSVAAGVFLAACGRDSALEPTAGSGGGPPAEGSAGTSTPVDPSGAAGVAAGAAAGANGASAGTAGIPTPGPALVEPTELVRAPRAGRITLVVAGGSLYWTDEGNGTVKRISTSGGPIEVLASGQAAPGPIAVDATSVFWANAGGTPAAKVVMKRALAGGAPAVFLPSAEAPAGSNSWNDPNRIHALLAHEDRLYVGRHKEALVLDAAGGAPLVLGRSPGGLPSAFALTATHLYQVEMDQNHIMRERLDGAQVGIQYTVAGEIPAPLVPDRVSGCVGTPVYDALQILDGLLYWGNGTTVMASPVGLLPFQAWSAAETANFDSLTGFVVSDGVAYLAEGFDEVIEKAPVATSAPSPDPASWPPTPTIIARHQPGAGQLAADGAAIYWRTCEYVASGAGDCRIMKLAK